MVELEGRGLGDAAPDVKLRATLRAAERRRRGAGRAVLVLVAVSLATSLGGCVADRLCRMRYLNDRGIGIVPLDREQFAAEWEYRTTPLGLSLAALSAGPLLAWYAALKLSGARLDREE